MEFTLKELIQEENRATKIQASVGTVHLPESQWNIDLECVLRDEQGQNPKNPSPSLDLLVHSEQLGSYGGNNILEGPKKMRKGRLNCDSPGTGNGQGYRACKIGSEHKRHV